MYLFTESEGTMVETPSQVWTPNDSKEYWFIDSSSEPRINVYLDILYNLDRSVFIWRWYSVRVSFRLSSHHLPLEETPVSNQKVNYAFFPSESICVKFTLYRTTQQNFGFLCLDFLDSYRL